MKRQLTLLLPLLCSCGLTFAGPVDIKVERKVLDKEDRLNRPRLKTEEQTTVLNIGLTNKSGKDTAMTVEWAVIVARGGVRKDLLVSGTETLSSVGNAQTTTVTTRAFPVLKNRVGKQDVEYKVIVKLDGKEVSRSVSTDKFDQIAAAAEPDEKPRRKKKP